jgi:murein L,D-transpeptidase YafK
VLVLAPSFRVLALALTLSACTAAASDHPCSDILPYVQVETSTHTLWLCDGTRAEKHFGVRLGKGGVGKSREGDGKVPLGQYRLGKARRSEKFGIFIPIAYPTAEQRAQGYTGGGVGIHGPHRRVAWLGRFVNTFDTTDGCVGLATDDETTELADWVTRHRALTVVLR